MEKQVNLDFKPYRKQKIKPEVQVIRNTYMSAAGMIKEIVIKKTYFIPIIRT